MSKLYAASSCFILRLKSTSKLCQNVQMSMCPGEGGRVKGCLKLFRKCNEIFSLPFPCVHCLLAHVTKPEMTCTQVHTQIHKMQKMHFVQSMHFTLVFAVLCTQDLARGIGSENPSRQSSTSGFQPLTPQLGCMCHDIFCKWKCLNSKTRIG